MARSFYARYAWPILIVATGLLPFWVWGTYQAFRRSNNNVSQWLPQDFPETETYKHFRRVFGSDDFAVISWDGCTLEDQRLQQLANALVPSTGNQSRHDGTECFARVLTGPGALEELMAPPFELSREKALERLQGTLVGPDRKTTCAVVTLSPLGDADRRRALAAMVDIAVEQCGLDRNALRLGGDAVFNAAIDIESKEAIRKWIGLASVVALAVAWLCLRRLKLMVMVLLVSVYAAVAGTGLIHYTNGQMNLVMVMLPVLIYVLTLSASVHMANYYCDALHASGPVGAPLRAVRAGWTPCALSAATTALGLGSLYVSHVVPVKMFGFYSAIGVLLGLGILFLVLPAMMELWPLANGWAASSSRSTAAAARRDRLLRRVVHWIIHYQRTVAMVCLALLVACGSGVAFIETSVRPARFFDPRSVWIQDSNWLADRIGPMVSVEVVLSVNKHTKMDFLDQMLLVDYVERIVRAGDCIGATISAATFAPSLAAARRDSGSVWDIARRGVLNKHLQRHRQVFVDNRYLSEDDGKTLWRVTARAEASKRLDYDEIQQQVRRRVDTFLEEYVPEAERVEVFYTGSAPLVFVAQRELLSGLFKSFCLAFALIAVVMVVLLRNFAAGMFAMLPNVFPAMITFGTMGWMRSAVDVGAMMTASVALGIAVDDTLHFLTWFRRAIVAGRTRRLAIVEAFRRCAPAMTQTTLIAGLAMLAFVLSRFQPVSQFGLLMFILLVAALVGDLLFLPALLATRAGARFVREENSSDR